MKVVILNSGMGCRMGDITQTHPKCMTEISDSDTILSRQLKIIAEAGIKEVVMTTGYFDKILVDYCHSLNLPLEYTFALNPIYDKTNYIYSLYCAKEALADDDIIMMHGDLVFEREVFKRVVESETNCMTVSSTLPLPEKDFKAVVSGNRIEKVGIEFFDSAVAAQPLYKLCAKDWKVWMDEIIAFCENDNRKCYAENAFNQVSSECAIYTLDVKNALCNEIDTPEDLGVVSAMVANLSE
ncbi:MAG: NTP transferase domain-containing protein [Clostridia bacterium]|nr:NTP transferase domain-containing protein [Clostridia bacterium]